MQRYPQNAASHAVFAQTLRRSGQLQQAAEQYRQAVALDPKVEPGYLALIVTQCEMNQPDAAFTAGQQAIAAGVDKATVGSAPTTSPTASIRSRRPRTRSSSSA